MPFEELPVPGPLLCFDTLFLFPFYLADEFVMPIETLPPLDVTGFEPCEWFLA
jgi:hypothetical protein